MAKQISALCAALILALALAAMAAGPLAASERTANQASLLQLINQARAHRGLALLRVHAALGSAALAHSRDMMDRDYFSHSSPSGTTCAARVLRAGYSTSGYRSWAVAEVIGWGMDSAGTPSAVFDSWMRSASHRAIILGRRWRDVGIGCASGTFTGASGSWMYTVDVGRRSR
jgi:uncharacterized protein YkwD